VGNTVVDHDGVQINHKGRVNTEAVLAWVYENYPDPQNVFVNGCSAGSYGSIFYAPSIADQYPEATFAHLGDAGLGVSTPEFDADGLADWGFFDSLALYFPDISQEGYTFSRIYESAAAQHPESFFTQYTALEDNVQKAFYELQGGDPAEWPALAQARLDELDPLENFAYFTATGELHCILPLAEFYSYETNGARFVEWVAALAAGEAVETVSAQP
jgi:acetyl esterase/lipase